MKDEAEAEAKGEGEKKNEWRRMMLKLKQILSL